MNGFANEARDPPRAAIVTLLMGLTMLVITSDFSLVSIALPTIGRDLRVQPALLSWVVSAYATVLAGFLIIGGRLTDAIGHRRCLAMGVVVFATGSALAAASGNIWMLIAARIVQGVGGAILAPASFSLIHAFLPEGPARHRALGAFSLMQGLALAIGPVLGGALTSSLGWRFVFLVNLPILAVGLLLTLLFLPRATTGAVGAAFDDIGGAVLLTLSTGVLLSALSNLGKRGLSSGLGLTLLCTAILGYIALWRLETRHPAPLIPMRLFRDPSLIGAALSMMGVVAGFAGMFLLLSLYLQSGLHVSAASAGVRMLPIALACLVSAPCAPVFMKRWPLRTLAIAAMAFAFAALLLLALSAPSGNYLAVVAPLLFLVIFGTATATVTLMGLAVAEVSAGDQGAASGLMFAGQQIASPAGVVITLAVLQAFPPGGTDGALAAYGRAFLAPAFMVGVGLLAVAVLTRAAPAPIVLEANPAQD
jgi:EmrB/QacA subfamily drug resistance transporter